LKKVVGLLDNWTKADNAARIEGVKRLGLPDNNTALDRAKAMGFSDETYYHGTPWDIHKKGIDFDRVGNNAVASHGFHMSNNPAEASSYALNNEGIDKPFKRWVNNGLGEDDLLPSVTPLKYKANNPAEFTTDFSHASALRGDELQSTIDNANDAVIIKGNSTNKQIEDWKHLALGDHAESIKAKDFDWGDKVNTHVVVSKDALLRSPLAHFNPKMAGIGGAGAILSADLMADELDLEHKPKVSAWDSLMNTIGGVNQQQAQAYGDTGAGAFNIASDVIADPSIVAELGIKGARGSGLGMLLQSNEVGAAENPDFLQQLQSKRVY
jgi:hypothetical protein